MTPVLIMPWIFSQTLRLHLLSSARQSFPSDLGEQSIVLLLQLADVDQ